MNFEKYKSSVFSFINILFGLLFILYCIFFILENLIHGFISNNFNFNLLIIPIGILGLLSVFSTQENMQEKAITKKDYRTMGFFALFTFLALLYKTKEMGFMSLAIAAASGILVFAVALLVSIFPSDSVEEQEIEVRSLSFVRKRILIPFAFIPVFIIALLFYNLRFLETHPAKEVVSNSNIIQTESSSGGREIMSLEYKLMKNTPIDVLNGGAASGSALTTTKFLQENNFLVRNVGDAEYRNYQNAIVRFRPEEVSVAESLADIISGIYPIVEKVPLDTDSPQIILILGKSNTQ